MFIEVNNHLIEENQRVVNVYNKTGKFIASIYPKGNTITVISKHIEEVSECGENPKIIRIRLKEEL
jgi:hypothetical protein